MEVTLFGTSSGTPTKHRNVSAAAVSSLGAKSWFLVDCGEATQHQILHARYSLIHLQAIFISHVHGDHCYGLPGLLASASMLGRTSPLKIICPEGIRKCIEVIVAETEMRLSYPLEFIDIANLHSPLIFNNIEVDVITLSHRTPSFGFRFSFNLQAQFKLNTEKLMAENIPKGQVWGRLQKGEVLTLEDGRKLQGKDYLTPVEVANKLIICGDNDSPQLLKPYMPGVSLLVHEATYTEDIALKVGPGPQHSYAKQVASFAQQVDLPNLVLTHFSPRYTDSPERSPNIFDIEHEAKAVYSGNLFLAKDLDCYQVDNRGEVSLQRSC